MAVTYRWHENYGGVKMNNFLVCNFGEEHLIKKFKELKKNSKIIVFDLEQFEKDISSRLILIVDGRSSWIRLLLTEKSMMFSYGNVAVNPDFKKDDEVTELLYDNSEVSFIKFRVDKACSFK
jgi:hypothetical protein